MRHIRYIGALFSMKQIGSANAKNDIARCAGVGSDEEGWREGCEDCARRLAESTSDVSAWMMPPAIIAFWCEFRIPTSD